MANALWITLIGMGLVFVAILLLWGLMALLVRVTARQEADEAPQAAEDSAAAGPAPQGAEYDRKRRAAAAAVAAAIALQQAGHLAPAGDRPAPDRPGTLTAWQAVNRASLLNQRATVTRKKVGR